MKRAAIVFAAAAVLGALVAIVSWMRVPALAPIDVTNKVSVNAGLRTMAEIAQFQPWIIGGTIVAAVSIAALLLIAGWIMGSRSARTAQVGDSIQQG